MDLVEHSHTRREYKTLVQTCTLKEIDTGGSLDQEDPNPIFQRL